VAKIIEEIIKQEGEKITVNWEMLYTIENENEDECYYVLKDLVKKNILNYGGTGSYMINAAGLNGSPSCNLTKFYFTKKEDAEAYAMAKYSGAMYPVCIMQFVSNVKK
jgi:hypothetical protein